jgi:hypothetical protein
MGNDGGSGKPSTKQPTKIATKKDRQIKQRDSN